MDYITLNPQESGEHIMKTAKHVKVDIEKCKEAALLVMDAVVDGKIGDIDYSANPLHPSGLSDEEKLMWVFLLDVLNFSFWPDEGKEYNVTWEGQTHTGYLAMCAALRKAYVERKTPIAQLDWMLTVDVEFLDLILKDDKGFSIPLILDRQRAIKQAGDWLFWSHERSFLNVVKKSNCNAQLFLRYILQCESFRDYSFYNGKKVSFFKRAQILINDTVGALAGSEEHKHLVDFKDLDTLTMFADYRVPQALNYLECLEYSPELLDELQSNTLLLYGSEKEVEIRGASIFAVQEMYKEIQRVRAAGPYRDMDFTNARRLLPIDIDVWLWMFRREHAADVEAIVPFHRTRSIYY